MRDRLRPRLLPLFAAIAFAALASEATPAHGASFTVNATHDAVDASPGDGICADAGGACTLRAAVMETNALAGADEISLPAGTYVLSIARDVSSPISAANGDLEITGDLGISGVGATNTVIEAALVDRIFYVDPPDPGIEGVKATISRETLRGGRSDGGGAIFSFGTVTIDATTLTENSASFGGALSGSGFILTNSTVT